MPVSRFWNKTKTLEKLLNMVKKYVNIKEVLIDKAFYSAEVINLLNSRRERYIILVPKKKFIKFMFESMYGEGISECVIKHELTLNKNFSKKKVKTNLVLVRDKEGYDWCFATNFYLRKIESYISHYKKRWGIETSNRCMDEVHIRTKSINIVVRTFLFVFSCLLYNLWIWLKLEGYDVTLRQLVYILFFKLVLGISYVFDPT